MKSARVLILLLLSACTPAQTQAWKTFGIEAGKCAGVGVLDAAGDALVDLLSRIDQPNGAPDMKMVGSDLAQKYGTQAALCAAGKAASILLPAIGMHAAPDARARAIQQLLDTQNEWAKQVRKP